VMFSFYTTSETLRGGLYVRVALGMAIASVTFLYVYLITVGRNITD
jgi:hypothetical protein